MVKLLSAAAPAKINLFLRVVGQRPNGYHELDSVFLPIGLADRLQVELRSAPGGAVTLRCNCPKLPTDERNLAVAAALRFTEEFAVRGAIAIDLHKEIPVGAGLGGGSSDAAAVLKVLAALARVDAPERLAKLALAIGADVPFFLEPRPARVRGVGERIEPLVGVPALDLVIAAPPVEVKTARIFAALEPSQWSGPGPEAELGAIARGELTAAALVNDLTAAAVRCHPEIAELKRMLEDLGARGAAMTGSGAAVFGVFPDPASAARAAAEAARRAPQARIISTRSAPG